MRTVRRGSVGRKEKLFTPHRPGINKRLSAYRRGERCEAIVAARVSQRQAEREAKRRSKRTGGQRSRSGRPVPRSPSAELRRLERALARRKTLEAKQRLQQRIKDLKRKLGL